MIIIDKSNKLQYVNTNIYARLRLFNLVQSVIGSEPKKPRNIIENVINLSLLQSHFAVGSIVSIYFVTNPCACISLANLPYKS